MLEIMIFVVVVLMAAFYLLPTIIATVRGNKQAMSIFVLNFLLGWTFVFWVIALVWAFTKE